MEFQCNKYNFQTQQIGLQNVVNARDLGGYVLPDGRVVKRNLLLRGGNLNGISNEDMRKLHDDLHLSLIFDFRTKMEVDHAPDKPVPGAEHLWLPTIDEQTEKMGEGVLPAQAYRNLHQYLIDHCFDQQVQETGRMMYPSMIRNEFTQLQYAVFFQKVLGVTDGAVYWHCSQGKDRTGLGSAFILAALGADRELIMEDFALSNDCYSKILASLKKEVIANGGGEEECKVIQTFVGVSTEYFADMLDIIDREYGGMNSFLLDILCLTEDDLMTLRNRYLE